MLTLWGTTINVNGFPNYITPYYCKRYKARYTYFKMMKNYKYLAHVLLLFVVALILKPVWKYITYHSRPYLLKDTEDNVESRV